MTHLLPVSVRLSLALLVCCLAQSSFASKRSSTKLTDVPQWAKEAVWYQIFPERFANGDTTNDPTLDDTRGSYPPEKPAVWQVSSWTGDWYKLQPWEEKEKGFYYHAQQRRYGGDLQGVINKLDYLKKLGVNAIYFNPLFESPSLHKYDAAMYHHIDNNFGPDPEGDKKIWAQENPANPKTWKWTSADKLFLKLIKEAHKRKMRVIIDGVFNHVGITFWAFLDAKKYGENSKFKDWFIIKKFDDPTTAADEFDYAGWYGVRELPELREDENGLLPGPRAHVHDIVKRWMDPNRDGNPSDGIDGWRLDVADMVAIPFWQDFRKWVREVNPNAYITGEVWWQDWANGKMFNAEKWLKGDAFDAVMNYRFAREAGYFFKAKADKISATEFLRRLDSLRSEYRSDVNYVLMNLYESHDTDRLPSQIINADTKYDKNVNLSDFREYDVRKPNAEELKTQKLMVLLQMTYLGAPMVYYGSEAGMWGADDPDERKPMLWENLKYDNESSHPFGKVRPDDENKFNPDLFLHYAKCIRTRTASQALKLGDFTTLLADDAADVIAFERAYRGEKVIVIINNSPSRQQIEIPIGDERAKLEWNCMFNWAKYSAANGIMKLELAGKSGIVLQARAK